MPPRTSSVLTCKFVCGSDSACLHRRHTRRCWAVGLRQRLAHRHAVCPEIPAFTASRRCRKCWIPTLSLEGGLRRTAPVRQRRVVGGGLTARGHNRQHFAVLCHPRSRCQGGAGIAECDWSASGGPVGGHRIHSVDLAHQLDSFANHLNDWYLLGGWGGPDAIF